MPLTGSSLVFTAASLALTAARPSSGDRALEGGDVLEGPGVGARRLCGVMAVAGRVKLTVQSEGSKYENSFLACCARAPI